jgi:LysR family transcriptional regulator, pca operon transcriptional activator
MKTLIETPARLLNKVRFRQIRCFVDVSRQGSFMAASGVLGLTQLAVPRSIRELETTLGVTLCDRSQRDAVLTAQARKLFDAAEAALLLTESCTPRSAQTPRTSSCASAHCPTSAA